ncbi:phosphoenolpyruvate hydrolase family protein [Singulisphaera sp. GP187]|uniref:phosphoenolpyruvate hydrolase family protein n=1 Tax=Singulisphaera sp. GP187 TaxID=1882752 RepID=UPI0009411AFA|nr:phosphoenolpyruvate hydrolase family protein [Singulisphaera sp. GP187]
MNSIHKIIASHRSQRSPLVGVVAGSGLVTSGALDAGADLLFALNSGFYRSQGSGSFAAFLPYGNANDQTEALLREHLLPRRGRMPVIAGLLVNDPTLALDERLTRLQQLGVEGIVNWPTVGFVDGQFREALEAAGLGTEAEIEMLHRAKAMGFATFGFVVVGDGSASRFARAEVDAMIMGLGLTHEVHDVQERRDHIQHSCTLLNAMLEEVHQTGHSPVCLAFGGPITTPEDLEQLLTHSAIDGFAGGSVFERLPFQSAIVSLVRRFKSLLLRAGDVVHPAGFGPLVGVSDEMLELYRRVERVAPFDVSVYIQGESGSGKELVATQIHRLSSRRHRAFVTLNCGAIPDSLFESELFGHEKGAFTGAHRRRLGKFELAHGGTLFLDEVADLSPHGQVALLRAIQQREITPVGGERPKSVDVRILAASNRPLSQLIDQGGFRADLYYRLNGVTIELPPLRRRLKDIPFLAEHILGRLSVQFKRMVLSLSPDFYAKIIKHDWPGNIRELEHVLTQSIMLEDGPILEGKHFEPVSRRATGAGPPQDDRDIDPLAARRTALRRALRQAGGNKSRAAELLGVTRRTLYAWIRDANLEADPLAESQ